MPDPELIAEQVAGALGRAVARISPVAGGSINRAFRLSFENGDAAFVKWRPGAPSREFQLEQAGLEWLAAGGAVAVPAVLARGENPAWLALGWIEPGGSEAGGQAEFGRALADLHRAGARGHGALPPGAPDDLLRIGPLKLSMPDLGDEPAWPQLYAERLLLPVLRLARDRDGVGADTCSRVEAVCERISSLVPDDPPASRLHGDLWSGNLHWDRNGRAWLIDPAAYGGEREIDLAMLELFGSPGRDFFRGYEDRYPLHPGYPERRSLWQLLPLLVHAALFGGGYGSRAAAQARHYL